MALTEAKRRANEKYIKSHYKQIGLCIPASEADDLEAFCKEHGYTKAGFIRQAIRDAMDRDLLQAPPATPGTTPTPGGEERGGGRRL